jgi:quercetin dioxygenase-like cupin family protein
MTHYRLFLCFAKNYVIFSTHWGNIEGAGKAVIAGNIPDQKIIVAKKVYRLESSDWKPIRPEFTEGIVGKGLAPKGTRNIDVTVTRVQPGGGFSLHVDPYHHVLYIFQGEGEVRLGEDVYPINPETVVEVPAGEVHAYRNKGDTEMILLTLNIPVEK